MSERPLRCFVAVELPSEMQGQIMDIQQGLAMPGVRMVRPEQVHITIKFLGDVPGQRLDDVLRAISKVPFQPFSARIEGLGAFPGRSIRVVWLGAQGEFAQLARAVDDALQPMGFPRQDGFQAHATLARVKDPAAGKALSARLAGQAGICLGTFLVDRFFLKKSTLTSGGPIYEDLAQFPSI
ncbi:MAG: 2',5' RNA ligase family [Methanosaeta sp. PtaB.Bin039]|nr:MAG: 2',5' RNA ligase family [Methanosaeta sp. PtaB.Bin039]OPY46002.1 MAG: 2',5' RNA ligase family [Methanosaeta sp. PtaU1.Bin028]HOT07341.1 RNA 2',3'-cyclic phosphodiesterase [Methanotrichaceae archaeon]HQF17329.1 RNA 2',3'-cyclic phosphodiesterase [Methanotrichaceae archaeon]HQI91925.1 RNA 2',3'-cyclic phosphodiesterase [Methanotrichaceae archaeon]